MVSPISNRSLVTNVLNNLNKINSSFSSSIGRLASGKGILKASDNAAGLAISELLKSDIKSLQKGVENVSQGISLTNVAEGGLQGISNILTEAKALAVQASTGTLNDDQRATIQSQFNSLVNEIDQIVESTEFSGRKILKGELSENSPALNIQVGINNKASSRVDMNVIPDVSSEALGLDNIDLSTQASAQNAIDSFGSAIQDVIDARGDVGSVQKRLTSIASTQNNVIEQLTAAESKISDADFASEISRLRQSQIQLNTAVQALQHAQFSSRNIGTLLNIST